VHYAYDTVALAKVGGGALVKGGAKKWYFLTADYAFGHSLEADATGWSRPTAARSSARCATR
jgi:branched-chain amino acid transport system substrate-binding protein